MAFSHGSSAKVLVNGYDLTGYLKSLTVSGQADTAETTAFGQTAKTYIPGLKDATLQASGMYDGGTLAADQILQAALGAGTTIWSYLPAGSEVGSRGAGVSGIDTAYEVSSPVDGVNEITASCQSSHGYEPITCHQPLAQYTASGTAGTVVDNGASSANGGVGYLQLTALNGGTATVKIQHSSNNSAYSDLVTFTNVTSSGTAVASERVVVTGTVNRYTRAVVTLTGGTATFQASFGRS